ncbi:RidA family protein [Roseibium sp.]|uniref:RidA family protein n=1 Tax=Roseibium sp. TaxID=1936156 RepID=UPI003BB09482
MQQRIIDPVDGIYAATPDYVHALEVRNPDRFLFVSGTMGLEPCGRAPATLTGQLDLIWNNLRRILVEADMSTDNIIRVTSYLGDREFAEANQTARLTALGKRRVPTTAIVVETLQSDWLVEVEIIAAA